MTAIHWSLLALLLGAYTLSICLSCYLSGLRLRHFSLSRLRRGIAAVGGGVNPFKSGRSATQCAGIRLVRLNPEIVRLA